MVVFCTKYALSKGIFMVKGELTYSPLGTEFFRVQTTATFCPAGLLNGQEWAKTWEEALEQAEVMRAQAIDITKAKLDRLRTKVFTNPIEVDEE